MSHPKRFNTALPNTALPNTASCNTARGGSAGAGLAFRRPGARRGISLLEVLAAMLVLTVGILSMARLIPVGIYEMSEANKLDQASTLGRAAFRDLEVRGYLHPKMWWDPAAGSSVLNAAGVRVLDYAWTPSRPSPWVAAGNSLSFPPAVVIDPLMVTANSADASIVQTFPYNVNPSTLNPNAPWIPRLSLFVPVTPTTGAPMSFPLADRIFRSSDEQSYTQPSVDNQRPTMIFGRNATNDRLQAASLGNDSWFVTIAPSLAEVSTYATAFTTTTAQPMATARQYTASIVVVNKRDLTLPPTTAVETPPPGERMLTATILAGGIAGGDVRLTAPANTLTEWLNVRPGQWIMLTCYVPATNRFYLDWYRIVGVGEIIAGSPATRDVTLHGPDWPSAMLQQFAAAFGTSTQVYATIVDGVTGVFQKTITLDGTSSWQN